jgi:hypothetical protein
VPSDAKISHAEVCAGLRKRVTEQFPDHFCVITIDENFTGV